MIKIKIENDGETTPMEFAKGAAIYEDSNTTNTKSVYFLGVKLWTKSIANTGSILRETDDKGVKIGFG